MAQSCDVENQKQYDQIHHNEDTRCTYFVKCSTNRERHTVIKTSHAKHHGQE